MIVRFHRIRKILIENCHALFGCGHYLHRFLFCLLCNLDFLGVIRIPILRIPSSLSSSGRGTSISFTRRISSFFAKSSFKSTQLELWKHQREREEKEWMSVNFVREYQSGFCSGDGESTVMKLRSQLFHPHFTWRHFRGKWNG